MSFKASVQTIVGWGPLGLNFKEIIKGKLTAQNAQYQEFIIYRGEYPTLIYNLVKGHIVKL